MYNFVIFCKTYSGDKNIFEKMLKSFNKYNKDNIQLFVSVPNDEVEIFKNYESQNVKVLSDESYAQKYLVQEKLHNHGLSIGYVNQEICKLTFWEAGLCKNYLCVDSDAEFIKDFYVADFMADGETPYTVLIQDKDLAIEKHYQSFWNSRQEHIKKIYDEVGLNDRRLRTCHGNTVLNLEVLKSLKDDFMSQKGYSYKDLLEISPFEFTWYNAWFQKCGLVKEIAVEPFFKVFHMRIDYIFYQLKYISLDDIKRSYVGIILNSNWKKPEIEYKKPNKLFRYVYNKILNRL